MESSMQASEWICSLVPCYARVSILPANELEGEAKGYIEEQAMGGVFPQKHKVLLYRKSDDLGACGKAFQRQ